MVVGSAGYAGSGAPAAVAPVSRKSHLFGQALMLYAAVVSASTPVAMRYAASRVACPLALKGTCWFLRKRTRSARKFACNYLCSWAVLCCHQVTNKAGERPRSVINRNIHRQVPLSHSAAARACRPGSCADGPGGSYPLRAVQHVVPHQQLTAAVEVRGSNPWPTAHVERHRGAAPRGQRSEHQTAGGARLLTQATCLRVLFPGKCLIR